MLVACCSTLTRKRKSLAQTDTEIKAKSIGRFFIAAILFSVTEILTYKIYLYASISFI